MFNFFFLTDGQLDTPYKAQQMLTERGEVGLQALLIKHESPGDSNDHDLQLSVLPASCCLHEVFPHFSSFFHIFPKFVQAKLEFALVSYMCILKQLQQQLQR